jgi:hypothetical protein
VVNVRHNRTAKVVMMFGCVNSALASFGVAVNHAENIAAANVLIVE